MSKPILAVDVDGVISLFGFDQPPAEEARFEQVDGMVHCISMAAGERLKRLSEHYELVWATGWEEKANDYLPKSSGYRNCPSSPSTARPALGPPTGSSAPSTTGGKDAPWPGSTTASTRAVTSGPGREEPTLLVPTESELGLEEVQVEALTAWARGLD